MKLSNCFTACFSIPLVLKRVKKKKKISHQSMTFATPSMSQVTSAHWLLTICSKMSQNCRAGSVQPQNTTLMYRCTMYRYIKAPTYMPERERERKNCKELHTTPVSSDKDNTVLSEPMWNLCHQCYIFLLCARQDPEQCDIRYALQVINLSLTK